MVIPILPCFGLLFENQWNGLFTNMAHTYIFDTEFLTLKFFCILNSLYSISFNFDSALRLFDFSQIFKRYFSDFLTNLEEFIERKGNVSVRIFEKHGIS